MTRNVSLDSLKLLMAFMVVGIHAGFLSDITWTGSYLTVNGIFRIAVPVFLIINGYYFYSVLCEKRQLIWLKRAMVLYIFWMCLYSFFWFPEPSLSFIFLTKIIKSIIIGYGHLWYISGMIIAAVILVVFHRFSSCFLMVTVFLSFLGGVLIQYLGNYHVIGNSTVDGFFNKHWIHRNGILFSYPFFCIGYLIKKHNVSDFFSTKKSGCYMALGLFLLVVESFFNFSQEGRDGGFDNFLSLLIVCPFLFIFFSKLKIEGNSKNISLYSVSVYLVHFFILDICREYTSLDATLLTVVVFLISMIASYFIIIVDRKFKFIL